MTRRMVANIAVSIDGRYDGPGSPTDMAWVVPHAVTDVARDQLVSLWQPATTALLGRKNAEGFLGFWPSVLDMPDADERDRGYARWLVDVDKVVLSTTLTDAPWERTRIADAPVADVVDELKAQDGGDILLSGSGTVIKALLQADRIDRLSLTIVPKFLGGGPTLFEDGLPACGWTLVANHHGPDGTIAVIYDRAR